MNGLVRLRVALVRLGFLVGRAFPLRSRVVLATGHAGRIGGNLAWIRDELRRSRPDVPMVELAVRIALGENDFAIAWNEGRTMTMEQALKYALGAPG